MSIEFVTPEFDKYTVRRVLDFLKYVALIVAFGYGLSWFMGFRNYNLGMDYKDMAPTISKPNTMDVTLDLFRVYHIGQIQRNDVIGYRVPREDKIQLGRVVALPGERLSMTDGKINVNGEDYNWSSVKDRLHGTFPDVRVPLHAVYVLADNRQKGQDSRHLGVIFMDNIVGRTVVTKK